MYSLKRVPIWFWLAIGSVVIIAVAVFFFMRTPKPTLPPGLAEKRKEVAGILDQLNQVQDVDIKPLSDLEANKNYAGAVALLDQALAVNAREQALASSLVGASNDLTKLAVSVSPDTVGAKAVETFSFLNQLAETEKKYYDDRSKLYEISRQYYADRLAHKNPAIPDNLSAVADAVNADLERARSLNGQFAAAVRGLDALFAK